MQRALMVWAGLVLLTATRIQAQTTNVWQGTGNASEAANWTLGVPLSSHHIRLDATSTGNLTWDAGVNDLPDTVASWTQTADYTGTVTIRTRYPGQGAFELLTIAGDCTIAGGTWTHLDDNNSSSSPWPEISRLNVAVGGDFTLSGTALIHANHLGHNSGRGAGRATGSFSGAGHGGLGTIGDDWTIRSDTYGSYVQPINLGSGGGDNGGQGGGAIRLVVTGDSSLGSNTVISANANVGRGGGAGGSVYLQTRSIVGGGTILAHGGDGASNRNHGGGGGRVAIKLTGTGETFAAYTNTATVAAYGGDGSGNRRGAAGTVYLQEGDQADGGGTLMIDNGGRVAHEAVTTLIPPAHDLGALAAIIIRNVGSLGIENPAVPLAFGSLPLTVAGSGQSRIRIVDDGNITWPATLVVEGYTLVADGLTNTLTNLQVGGDEPGAITHPRNFNAEWWKIDLTLSGDLTVKSNGTINANVRGFDTKTGPGNPGNSQYHGGGYGGIGSPGNDQVANSRTYGSFIAPVNLGSGGNEHAGGGAIILDVAGTTVLEADSLLTSIGGASRGSGSGGSIYLRTGSLSGSGTINAEGGPGASNHPRGGGGGRISVRLTEPNATFSAFTGTLTARGGIGGSTNQDGAAGSIYLETGDGSGSVVIDNHNRRVMNSTIATQVPPSYEGVDPAFVFTDELQVTAFVVTNRGRLHLPADALIGYLEVTTTDALVDLNGFTLSVLPDLVITGAVYGVGSYTADELGPLVIDSAGGGAIEVRPLIDNADGATDVDASGATLNGILYAGEESTAVFVYWGLSDGGTDAAAWDQTNVWHAPQAAGAFSTNVVPPALQADSMHYYRFFTTNAVRQNWAASTEIFMTGEVTVQKTADADEEGLVNGTFELTRPGTAVNEALTVFYSIGGTAVPDVNYVDDLGTSRTFGIGEETVTITVTPLLDEVSQDDETVILTLQPGPYAIGTPGSAEMTIFNQGMPGAPTNVWIGAGSASSDANWSLGHAPTATEDVFLGGFSTDNMTWDLTNAVASWTQTEQYTGTVTIETVYPTPENTYGTFTNLVILGDCTVDGGVWRHGLNVNNQQYRLSVSVGGDFHLGPDAEINMDTRGFNNQRGPGNASGSFAGGGHGGLGAAGSGWVGGSSTYGSLFGPETLGSGGAEGRGGGALRLVVTNDAVIASGAVISTVGGGGRGAGAGGSIWITARSISGGGTLRAEGGEGSGSNNHNGGGGGRIALVLTGAGETFAAFTNAAVVQAYGGPGSAGRGAAGTVYLQAGDQPDGEGTLIIDNNNHSVHHSVATVIPSDTELGTLSSIVIRNNGILGLSDPDQPLTFAALPIAFAGYGQAALRVVGDANIIWPTTLVVDDYTLIADGLAQTLTNLQVGGDAPGAIRHPANHSSEVWTLDLALSGDLTVKSNGWINADGRGFANQTGPGAGSGSFQGGGHGGLGSPGSDTIPNSSTYGSILAPMALGSGGAEDRGGGIVRLTVAGHTLIEATGMISAHGGSGGRGTGAGGSIHLVSASLSGGGSISAHGGTGGSNHPHGGGGGRIAVRLTGPGQTFSTFTGVTTAYGGLGGGSQQGAAGTVYRETGDGDGRVLVDNATRTVKNDEVVTELPPAALFDDDLSAVAVDIVPNGRVRLTGAVTVNELDIAAGAVLDLNGATITVVERMVVDGELQTWWGGRPASEFGPEVIDSDPGETGLVYIEPPPPGTLFLLR